MLQRLNCPLTEAEANVIFTWPYTEPELMRAAQMAGVENKVAGLPYEVRYCPTSGLHFQTWVLDETELAGLYSPSADPSCFESEISRQELHWLAHLTEEILVLRQMIGVRRPRVLDFGCNWGKWASMALAHGCEVYGLDVNRAAATFSATRGVTMLGFEDLPGMAFDFINVDQVAEHLSNPVPIIRGLAAGLKPNGFLKLSVPNNPSLPQRLQAAQRRRDGSVLATRTLDALAPLQHVNLFNPQALTVLGCTAGLMPVKLPFWKCLGAGQLWNLPRQLNRNLTVPFKRAFGLGTYRWFRKPLG